MSFMNLNNLGSITEIESGKTLLAPEILLYINRRSAQFLASGLKKSDRVILLHGNTISFFIDILAIWSLSACAVALDKSTPEIELSALAKDCGAQFKIEVSDGELVSFYSVNCDQEGHLILYTSGTSARAKAVVHSLATINNRFLALKNSINLIDFKNSLCILPTHFGHGLIGNSLFPLINGCNLFISSSLASLNTNQLANIVDAHKISFISTVPSLWSILKNHAPPKLNTLVRVHCASSMFPQNILPDIKSWAPFAKIYNVYGLTEFASWVSGYELTNAQNSGPVGTGWGADFKIIAANEDGVGLVSIRSESLMLKYLHTNNESAMTDRWFKTSDLGFYSQNSGLTIVGRMDDIINRGGIKINPEEIESVLLKNSSIATTCVFSIPDDSMNHHMVACYTLNEKTTTAADLELWCRKYLPANKIPNKWCEIDSVSVTIRGKIDRKNIRKKYLDTFLEEAPLSSNIKFESLIRKVFNLNPDFNIHELSYGSTPAWDSIKHIELFIEIKKVFKISFSAEEIISIKNYRQLNDICVKKINSV